MVGDVGTRAYACIYATNQHGVGVRSCTPYTWSEVKPLSL